MWGSVGASGMHGKGPTEGSRGARARAERTWNMYFMVVTLDVSKLSGWLNADAPRNIWYMFVTLEVSQLETSALKKFKSLKR